MDYTKKEMHSILTESMLYINGDGSYRIDYVPEYDLWESGEDEVLMTDDYDGDQVSFTFEEIDLNDPEVMVYKPVLANPIRKVNDEHQ